VIPECCTALADVSRLVYSQAVLTRLQTVNCSLYHTSAFQADNKHGEKKLVQNSLKRLGHEIELNFFDKKGYI
jgi:hypothetical protein